MKYNIFFTYTALAKTRLTLMLTASALVGHIIADQGELSSKTVLICLAVFVLASGAAIVNNIQDRNLDQQMTRTCRRPLPAGRVSWQQAALLAGVHFLLAALLIYPLSRHSYAPALLSFLAIVLYNGIYTQLKPKTLWAIVPGSICGVLPPLIGWYATGSSAPPEQIVLLAMVIWMWQFPHFWLKMMSFSPDYLGKETLLAYCSPRQVDMFIAVWTVSFAVLTLAAPFYGLISSAAALGALIMQAFLMVGLTWFFLFTKTKGPGYQRMFIVLNCALFLFMSISAADNIAAYTF
jgi:protoheme IX farnesyltransferase